jgi:hypothetical protein
MNLEDDPTSRLAATLYINKKFDKQLNDVRKSTNLEEFNKLFEEVRAFGIDRGLSFKYYNEKA